MSIDDIIDEIEAAVFDRDEPGCRDTDWGDELLLTEIGRIRLRKIIKKVRQEARGK